MLKPIKNRRLDTNEIKKGSFVKYIDTTNRVSRVSMVADRVENELILENNTKINSDVVIKLYTNETLLEIVDKILNMVFRKENNIEKLTKIESLIPNIEYNKKYLIYKCTELL